MWPFGAGNKKCPCASKEICKSTGAAWIREYLNIFSCQGGARILKKASFPRKSKTCQSTGFRQAGTALCSLRLQFLRSYLIIAVQLAGMDGQPCGQKLFNIKGVLRGIIRQVFIVRVFGNIVFAGEEGADAPDLQEAFPAIHHGKLVYRHQILSTSTEYQNHKRFQE